MKHNLFGNVRKLPSGRFQVRYIDGSGARITARSISNQPLTFETQKQARTYLLHLQSVITRGVNPYAIAPINSVQLIERPKMFSFPDRQYFFWSQIFQHIYHPSSQFRQKVSVTVLPVANDDDSHLEGLHKGWLPINSIKRAKEALDLIESPSALLQQ